MDIMKLLKRITAVVMVLFVALTMSFTLLPETVHADDEEESNTVSADFLGADIAAAPGGFHPGSGNYIRIRASFESGTSLPAEDSESWYTTVRILNTDSNVVYSVTKKRYAVDLKWNGKASANNTAGLSSGSYIPDGEYTAEIKFVHEADGQEASNTHAETFQVNSSAEAGKKAAAGIQLKPVYTGNDEEDYLAELMIREAGVKMNMSSDQKVKRIYKYIRKNFKHRHYTDKWPKKHFHLSKMKARVQSFKTKSDSRLQKGELLYSDPFGIWMPDKWESRCGVCDDQAMVFMVMCNHVGVEAGKLGGIYFNNGTKWSHAWNYAVIKGTKYYYNVDTEIQCGTQTQFYKMSKAKAKKHHKISSTLPMLSGQSAWEAI